MNKYEKLAMIPILFMVILLLVFIEYQIFIVSILVSIIANIGVFWVFGFLYLANREERRVEK